mmetsp:Transcript_21245/g.73149  ORF Transcript_21245/g.73149 Transcript_21245/m.73149 type:complete len:317 (+) Transcript_21245:248-1198(+)
MPYSSLQNTSKPFGGAASGDIGATLPPLPSPPLSLAPSESESSESDASSLSELVSSELSPELLSSSEFSPLDRFCRSLANFGSTLLSKSKIESSSVVARLRFTSSQEVRCVLMSPRFSKQVPQPEHSQPRSPFRRAASRMALENTGSGATSQSIFLPALDSTLSFHFSQVNRWTLKSSLFSYFAPQASQSQPFGFATATALFFLFSPAPSQLRRWPRNSRRNVKASPQLRQSQDPSSFLGSRMPSTSASCDPSCFFLDFLSFFFFFFFFFCFFRFFFSSSSTFCFALAAATGQSRQCFLIFVSVLNKSLQSGHSLS